MWRARRRLWKTSWVVHGALGQSNSFVLRWSITPWTAQRAASRGFIPQLQPSATAKIQLFGRATTAKTSAMGSPWCCVLAGLCSYRVIVCPSAFGWGRCQWRIPAIGSSDGREGGEGGREGREGGRGGGKGGEGGREGGRGGGREEGKRREGKGGREELEVYICTIMIVYMLCANLGFVPCKCRIRPLCRQS